MTSTTPDSETLTRLLDELLAAYRSGQHDALDDYCRRFPESAAALRDLFPALVAMEQHKPRADQQSDEGEFSQPARLGNYQVVQEIGRGGMGVVYEARHLTLNRRVALKVMSPHLSRQPKAAERFRREARSAAQLHHTNIVPVFEVGNDGELAYYAMQFIQGQSLDNVIAALQRESDRPPELAMASELSIPLAQSIARTLIHRAAGPAAVAAASPNRPAAEHPAGVVPKTEYRNGAECTHSACTDSKAESAGEVQWGAAAGVSTESSSWGKGRSYFRNVARVGIQIADALQYAHEKNVLHRDVKPANILLDLSGTAWITDFGLAAQDGESSGRESQLTETGDVIGTLRYLAPERLHGQRDAQGDVYGLGITLYELLTLQPAFQPNDRAELLHQVVHHQPPAPRVVDPRIPRDLETIVLKSIHKEPKRRYASARDLAGDLRRFLADEPIRARRIGPVGRLRLWYRRNRWLAVGVFLSVASLLVLSIGSIIASVVFRAQRDEADSLRRQTEQAQRDGEFKSWEAHLEAAHGLRLSQAPGQRFASLRAIEAALELPIPPNHSRDELRSEAMSAICLPDFEVARQIEFPRQDFIACLNHDFTLYALVKPNGDVELRDIETNQLCQTLPSIGPLPGYFAVRFSEDDSLVALFNGSVLRIWNSAAPSSEPIFARDDIAEFALDPQGKRVAIVTRKPAIQLVRLDSGNIENEWHLPPGTWTNRVAWNPRRNLLALGYYLFDLDQGELVPLRAPINGAHNPVWHPSGNVLALCDQAGEVHLWNIDLKQPHCKLQVHESAAGALAEFNRRGDRLLVTNWGQMWHLFDVHSGIRLMSLRAGQNWLGFGPDDGLVAADSWNGVSRVYRFAAGDEIRYRLAPRRETFSDGDNRIVRRAFSPERDLLLLDSTTRVTQVVDVRTDGSPMPLELPGRPVDFEPDGAILTNGELGLLRWPRSHRDDGTLVWGPPNQLLDPSFATDWAYDPVQRRVVIPRRFDPTLVCQLTDSSATVAFSLSGQQDVRAAAVSPDGRWIVTGSHDDPQAGGVVWDSRTGNEVARLPIATARNLTFSPDGKWLFTLGDRPRVWKTDSWREGPHIPVSPLSGFACFSDNSELLILEDERGWVRLVLVEEGRELARFSATPFERAWPVRLDDSGLLTLVGADNEMLYEIDLHQIRRQLVDLGLDLDYPPFDERADSEPKYRELDCDLGGLGRRWQIDRWRILSSSQQDRGDYDRAVGTLRRILALESRNADANNSLAWLLISQPAYLANPAEAVRLARIATEEQPNVAAFWNTLGTALYRNGQWAEAIQSLEKSKSLGQTPPEYDLLFLAMSHAKLGHADQARECLKSARPTIAERLRLLPAREGLELEQFLQEAESVVEPNAK